MSFAMKKISCRPDFQDEYALMLSWMFFASPFSISNNSKVICIFDIKQIFYRCSAIKTFKYERYNRCRSGHVLTGM